MHHRSTFTLLQTHGVGQMSGLQLASIRRVGLTIAVSAALGVAIVINQFGPVIVTYVPIGPLSPLWTVNDWLGPLGNGWVSVGLTGLMMIAYLVLASNPQIQRGFAQGSLLGLFGLPILALALSLIALIGWLVLQLLGILHGVFVWLGALLAPVLAFLLTPVTWLLTNVIGPVVRFLLIPVVWLWDHILVELLKLILIPLSWLWENVIAVVGRWLVQFVFRPFVFVLVAAVGATVALAPFAAVGMVAIQTFRGAAKGPLTPQGAFAHGVGLGFLCLDALVMTIMDSVTGIQLGASVFLVVMSLAPVVYLLRIVGNPSVSGLRWSTLTLPDRCRHYFAEAKLDAAVACALLPISVTVALASRVDDEAD